MVPFFNISQKTQDATRHLYGTFSLEEIPCFEFHTRLYSRDYLLPVQCLVSHVVPGIEPGFPTCKVDTQSIELCPQSIK